MLKVQYQALTKISVESHLSWEKKKSLVLRHPKINLASAQTARRSVVEDTHSVKQLLRHAKIVLTAF